MIDNIMNPNRTNPEINTAEVQIPEGTTKIPERFFAGCDQIKYVHLPDSVECIGPAAFIDCSNLEAITLPPHLKEIGFMAFWNCKKLRNITIPDSVVKIGNDCFHGSGLRSVTLPSQLEILEECVFCECKELNFILLPESLKEIHNRVFWGSGLQAIRIPANVQVVGESAFLCDYLTEVTICNSNTKFVKCLYHMFNPNEKNCKLKGNGFNIPGPVKTGKKILVYGGLLLLLMLSASSIFIISICAHLYFKKKYMISIFELSKINDILFTRHWYERVPILQGDIPDHLVFGRIH